MPKKKKKGGDKEKKVRKSRHLNEKDTLSYEQEILDNNKQIARLRTRNHELENEVQVVQNKLRQLEEDRSDVIAHLKRNLLKKNEEVQELNERLYALDELRKDEIVKFKKKEEEMEEKYRTMENNLTTEIQLSAGKLSALEEWRVARNDLMKKFEIQEKQMAEQEERHNKQLYEVEKNLIISKSNLQKEMEERLYQLAQSFRNTTNLRIADTTKRLLYENIALNKELDVMFKVFRNLNAKVLEYKHQDYNLKLQASLCEQQTASALKKVLKQDQLIKRFINDHNNMIEMRGRLKCLEESIKQNEYLANEYQNKYEQSQNKIRRLKEEIEETRKNKENILKDIEANSKDISTLKEVIERAKECIETMLKLCPEQTENKAEQLETKDKFLKTMLDILGSDINLQTRNQIQKEKLINKYTQGSLGLVCSHLMMKNESKLISADADKKVANQVEEDTCRDECSFLNDESSKESPFDSECSINLSFLEKDHQLVEDKTKK